MVCPSTLEIFGSCPTICVNYCWQRIDEIRKQAEKHTSYLFNSNAEYLKISTLKYPLIFKMIHHTTNIQFETPTLRSMFFRIVLFLFCERKQHVDSRDPRSHFVQLTQLYFRNVAMSQPSVKNINHYTLIYFLTSNYFILTSF